MALVGERVTVTDTATKIVQADGDGISVVLRNAGGGAIDIGDASVASGSGFELGAGEELAADLAASEAVFGIAPSLGSEDVHVLRNRS